MKMKYYSFQKSRSGDAVPSLILPSGDTRPLHSLFDPKREAERLISTITGDTGFLIFLGIGGGFYPQAALENTTAKILVIDYNRESLKELFQGNNYSELFCSKRVTLLVDPQESEIKDFILHNYRPVLNNGIKVIPLRSRTEIDSHQFEKAAAAIKNAIEIVSSDYSVQVHFGKRWYKNIIRNLLSVNSDTKTFSAIESFTGSKYAIVAAGPSLDENISSLAECKSRKVFIICSDTALPVLLHHKIEPDAVVSVDCQHISYYHFMGNNLSCPLIIDIASPPLLCNFSFSKAPIFFSSGHPLAVYASKHFYPFPFLDASGGNVTYVCLSLAKFLNAKHITLFGADFSYIRAKTYARGTYIYPYFEKRQNRFSTLEAQFSEFLFRGDFLEKENDDNNMTLNYKETSKLRFYRKKIEELAASVDAEIIAAPGKGAPLNLPVFNEQKTSKINNGIKKPVQSVTAVQFLEQYKNDIVRLPELKNHACYLSCLDEKQKDVFTTLLPVSAYLKNRYPKFELKDIIEETKKLCIKAIDNL